MVLPTKPISSAVTNQHGEDAGSNSIHNEMDISNSNDATNVTKQVDDRESDQRRRLVQVMGANQDLKNKLRDAKIAYQELEQERTFQVAKTLELQEIISLLQQKKQEREEDRHHSNNNGNDNDSVMSASSSSSSSSSSSPSNSESITSLTRALVEKSLRIAELSMEMDQLKFQIQGFANERKLMDEEREANIEMMAELSRVIQELQLQIPAHRNATSTAHRRNSKSKRTNNKKKKRSSKSKNNKNNNNMLSSSSRRIMATLSRRTLLKRNSVNDHNDVCDDDDNNNYNNNFESTRSLNTTGSTGSSSTFGIISLDGDTSGLLKEKIKMIEKERDDWKMKCSGMEDKIKSVQEKASDRDVKSLLSMRKLKQQMDLMEGERRRTQNLLSALEGRVVRLQEEVEQKDQKIRALEEHFHLFNSSSRSLSIFNQEEISKDIGTIEARYGSLRCVIENEELLAEEGNDDEEADEEIMSEDEGEVVFTSADEGTTVPSGTSNKQQRHEHQLQKLKAVSRGSLRRLFAEFPSGVILPNGLSSSAKQRSREERDDDITTGRGSVAKTTTTTAKTVSTFGDNDSFRTTSTSSSSYDDDDEDCYIEDDEANENNNDVARSTLTRISI